MKTATVKAKTDAKQLKISNSMAENQKMRALYDAASKKYNLGSYEHFEKTMQDEGKRKTFYDAASKKFNLGSYEDYSTKLGFMSGGHEDVAGRTLGVSRKEDNPQYVPEQKLQGHSRLLLSH